MNREFCDFFKKATGKEPYPYQVRVATAERIPDILHLPTGSGKTLTVAAMWLWKRKYEGTDSFPRRLVYCLPLRVLVEQTYGVFKSFLENAGFPDIGVYKLLGGEVEDVWRFHPEQEAIIIGTQDMLLSRALNRGFAESRFAWPLDFALLNNDCFWAMDEVQLMGSGLATSAQLAAFRERLGTWGTCKTVWLSATLDVDWLKTVDFREVVSSLEQAELYDDDLSTPTLFSRMNASKTLRNFEKASIGHELHEFIKGVHRQGTTTLAVFNTVERAVETYNKLKNLYRKDSDSPELILIHSRFRGAEREQKQMALTGESARSSGRIIISTQVVEAGVDISSAVLITELAPWPSLVQRMGRCNRYGEHDSAEVYWVDLEEKKYPPYDGESMETAREMIKEREGESLSPLALQKVPYHSALGYKFVLRMKDIMELFDNTPDLSGFDIDVSRFIRDTEELDLQVFWRSFEGEPGDSISSPSTLELCPVHFYDFRNWLDKEEKKRREGKKREEGVRAYVWNHLEGRWVYANQAMLWPGSVVLLPCTAGGYDCELGWNKGSKQPVPEIQPPVVPAAPESTTGDPRADSVWVLLPDHGKNAKKEMRQILEIIRPILEVNGITFGSVKLEEVLELAALFHDIGKASPVFQEAFTGVPKEYNGMLLAKGSMKGGPFPYRRKYFRHELVSALLILQNSSVLTDLSDSADGLALLSYLVGAHHGKLRCAIRALPGEEPPRGPERFALGVRDGDVVGPVDINGYRFPRVELSLACMELGAAENGSPSWTEMFAALLDAFGPFRLAYLEALVRSADIKASEAEKNSGGGKS